MGAETGQLLTARNSVQAIGRHRESGRRTTFVPTSYAGPGFFRLSRCIPKNWGLGNTRNHQRGSWRRGKVAGPPLAFPHGPKSKPLLTRNRTVLRMLLSPETAGLLMARLLRRRICVVEADLSANCSVSSKRIDYLYEG